MLHPPTEQGDNEDESLYARLGRRQGPPTKQLLVYK